MELFKDISKDPKEVARLLFDYVQSHDCCLIEGNVKVGFKDNFVSPDDNFVKQLCIIAVDLAIDACSGLYDELLSVEYGKFEEQDIERYNWLCRIRKHLENNFQISLK